MLRYHKMSFRKSFGTPSNFNKKHKNSFSLYLYTAFMLHMLYLHT